MSVDDLWQSQNGSGASILTLLVLLVTFDSVDHGMLLSQFCGLGILKSFSSRFQRQLQVVLIVERGGLIIPQAPPLRDATRLYFLFPSFQHIHETAGLGYPLVWSLVSAVCQ